MSTKQCPECKSENVMPIHYGFIDDPDAMERIKNRIKIKLGYRLGFSKAIGMPKLITIDPTITVI
jgi:hypothetical protein